MCIWNMKYCESLQSEQLREILADMAETSPSTWKLVKSDIEGHGNRRRTEDNPGWCVCGQCIEMEEERDQVCCQNNIKNHENAEFRHLILDDRVLDLAMRGNSDWLQYPFDPEENACWRYTAYRQYIMWFWGHLGSGNRKVIPSCILRKIRERFPSVDGIYRGFMDRYEALR
ncbi:P2X purinoceptor 7-like [Hydractinia symbiolongicarpus]|uniref:P2X purinoceptor 7-like n=1 Tax=Hydractinia symbiolongicarpus TaxID=13093 RepID=UPI00254AE6AA|nr:P2X purinoceptor 7-like [Hydractinia symbiolongicarpus]